MSLNGSLCVFMCPYKSLWVIIGRYWSLCVLIDPYALLWIPMGFNGPYRSINVFMGFVGPDASLWILMDPYWLLKILIRPNGF